jgi:hypothetical protein
VDYLHLLEEHIGERDCPLVDPETIRKWDFVVHLEFIEENIHMHTVRCVVPDHASMTEQSSEHALIGVSEFSHQLADLDSL